MRDTFAVIGLKNIRPASSRDYSVDWQNIKYYEQQQGYYYGIDYSTLNNSCKFYAEINNAYYKWRFLQEV